MERILDVNNNVYNDLTDQEEEIPVKKQSKPSSEQSRPAIKPAGKKSRFNWLMLSVFAVTIALICAAFFVFGFFIGKKYGQKSALSSLESATSATVEKEDDPGWNVPDYVEFQPIVKNEYSRPGTALEEVNGVVVHYVANPGSTAAQNRNYFNNLAITHTTWASSHFIIGLDGEALQLIPLNEWAYCSNERNKDTISIECCHPEEDGKFTDKTYGTLVKLLADLCREYDLDPRTQILRHYDITEKPCPLYFVEHEDEWHELLADVAAALTASPAETGR